MFMVGFAEFVVFLSVVLLLLFDVGVVLSLTLLFVVLLLLFVCFPLLLLLLQLVDMVMLTSSVLFYILLCWWCCCVCATFIIVVMLSVVFVLYHVLLSLPTLMSLFVVDGMTIIVVIEYLCYVVAVVVICVGTVIYGKYAYAHVSLTFVIQRYAWLMITC